MPKWVPSLYLIILHLLVQISNFESTNRGLIYLVYRMERLSSVPRTPLVKRHVVHEYVSAPSTVFFLNTSQRLCPAPDRNTNLKAYFNGTDTNYPGCLVLVIFIPEKPTSLRTPHRRREALPSHSLSHRTILVVMSHDFSDFFTV